MWQVLLHRDEDGAWIIEVPALRGCRSDGATREEALENIREAIDLWLEVARERGWDVPEPVPSYQLEVIDGTAA